MLCLSGFLIGTNFSEESSASIFELVCLFEMSVPMYKTIEHLSSEDLICYSRETSDLMKLLSVMQCLLHITFALCLNHEKCRAVMW